MEEKKEYLNEEEYQKNAKKLKKAAKIVLIVGIVMLVVGAILTVLGVIGFGSSAINAVETEANDISGTIKGTFGSMGIVALGGILSGSGLFVAAVGGIIMLVAHNREITAFSTQQVMPVAKEGIEKIAPSAGVAAKEIAKGIKEGLNEADKEGEQK